MVSNGGNAPRERAHAPETDAPASTPTGHAGMRAAGIVEQVLGCKWTVGVLLALRAGVHRPGALERECPGISTKVLNERLRKLLDLGLVERRAYPEVPPRVEYHFTGRGERFLGVLDAVDSLQAELESNSPHRTA